MFSHVMVGTNDIEASKRFYDAVLGLLGAGEPVRTRAASGHQRLFYRHDGTTFCVSEPIDGQAATVANGGTIGFNLDPAVDRLRPRASACRGWAIWPRSGSPLG